MRILHYSLGVSPYRTGGLTKYSQDIMEEQIKQGENVYLLFPGSSSKSGKLCIKRYKMYRNIEIFEIINPLPVPLLDGIINPKLFMSNSPIKKYRDFLNVLKIEVVHIHTFMGLHIEFLKACKELGLKVIYTTHDYFGLCPKVNFLDYNNKVCTNRNAEKCAYCNLTAGSLNKIKLLQSRTYRFFKNLGGVDILKKINIRKKQSEKICNINKNINRDKVNKNDMSELLQYYIDMFNLIDLFLFNSNLSKKIYNNYIDSKGEVLNITHNKIVDNRKINNYDKKILKLTYLGPNKNYKGFNLLIAIMKSLKSKGYNNIIMNMYGDSNISKGDIENNIKINGRYRYDELSKIFRNTDVVIVPSIWYETFGFVTLEALSFGVPVIVTTKVGSKDIINNNGILKGYIIEDIKEEIERVVIDIYNNRDILKDLNKNIVNDKWDFSIKSHCEKIKNYYLKL